MVDGDCDGLTVTPGLQVEQPNLIALAKMCLKRASSKLALRRSQTNNSDSFYRAMLCRARLWDCMSCRPSVRLSVC